MKRVSTRIFDEAVDRIVGTTLKRNGYLLSEGGTFFQETPSGLRRVVIFDFRPTRQVFYVIIGLNSSVISNQNSPDGAGARLARYLGYRGIKDAPSPFRTSGPDCLNNSLQQALRSLDEFATPWFEQYKGLADLADALDERYPFSKGVLYARALRYEEARKWLRAHEEKLSGLLNEKGIEEALARTRELLSKL